MKWPIAPWASQELDSSYQITGQETICIEY